MTTPLFREDAYLKEVDGVVVEHTEQGIILDRSIFYPTGGGQPSDKGSLEWESGKVDILEARKGPEDKIILFLPLDVDWPAIGTTVHQVLDMELRHQHMRIHTALHLLSVVIPLPVTGGQISAQKGRLDFLMPEAPEDRDEIINELNALIARDLDVSESWITDQELAEQPDLVKTMSVKPPQGAGRVRLVRIGTESDQIDLQPCGGTHVRNTSEIGALRIGKIENKGKQNRRVNIHFVD
jgi:misacylated tRNA(Ala) deacylase